MCSGEVAVEHGARLITHLFNAMLPVTTMPLINIFIPIIFVVFNKTEPTHIFTFTQFHHRDPGLVGLLTSDKISESQMPYYGIISDGIHTHPAALRIAYKTNKDGLILVTDAISPLGFEDGEHHIGQLRVRIDNGMARIAGTETLCGSIASMDKVVINLNSTNFYSCYECTKCFSNLFLVCAYFQAINR